MGSEHEDACCVTVELLTPAAHSLRDTIESTMVTLCRKGGGKGAGKGTVSKGSMPDHVRCAPLPRNFKGTVKLPELKEAFIKHLADAAH